ncbi:MAG: hypothetical protein ACYC36_13540 [Bellilinea sp.]
MKIQLLEQIIQIIESIFGIGAIIFAGIWTYKLFIKNRQKYPHANISQVISHSYLSDGKALIHVAIIFENIGNVLLKVKEGEVRLLQIMPLAPTIKTQLQSNIDIGNPNSAEINWPEIIKKTLEIGKEAYELEPSESDSFHFDFVIDSTIKIVEIYTFIQNSEKKNGLGWTSTSIYELH